MVDRFVGNYDSIYLLWWFDPEKTENLSNAMENDKQLPINAVDIKYWPNWNNK